MKKLTFFLFISFSINAFTQHLNFKDLSAIDNRVSSFTSYSDSKGQEIKIGDTLIIVKPETEGNYTFVYIGNDIGGYKYVDRLAQNKEVVVESIRVTKFKSEKYVNMKCTEQGLVGVKYMLAWEKALNAKEVKKKGSITKDEILKILNDKKNLLDLGVIKQQEYDSLLNLYKPILMK
jgi:hypothetical protein